GQKKNEQYNRNTFLKKTGTVLQSSDRYSNQLFHNRGFRLFKNLKHGSNRAEIFCCTIKREASYLYHCVNSCMLSLLICNSSIIEEQLNIVKIIPYYVQYHENKFLFVSFVSFPT